MRLGGGGQNQKGFMIEWIECSMREKDEFERAADKGGKERGKGVFDELVERNVGQSGKSEFLSFCEREEVYDEGTHSLLEL